MRTKLTAVAALAAMAVTLTAVAAAGPVAAKQRVAIQVKGGSNQQFVLAAMTSGAITRDTGVASFCCWTERHIVRDGQAIDFNDPRWALTGKLGTIVGRNQIGFVDVPDGWAVFTGTWKVIRGTGAYAGLSGGGRVAGVSLVNGTTKAQFEGFLSGR